MKNILILSVVLSFIFAAPAWAQKKIRIGAKNFTEQFLLATMTSELLKKNGYEVELTTGLGTLVMRQALEVKQLDLVWDYTGTGLIVYYHVPEKLTGYASYERIRDLDAKKDLMWLSPSALDNGYAVTMQKEVAAKLGITTLEELANYIKSEQQKFPKKKHLFALEYEFASRPDGLKPLQKAYEFEFKRTDIKQMDPGLVYTALRNGQVLIGLAFNSDGRIAGFNLTDLKDNRGFFPSYFVTPVVRKEVLLKFPELEKLLGELSKKLDTDKMRELNRRVDIEHQSIERVAREFLKKEGLL
ncbi:glycine betaine ABC transporter substrate-binding protein [Bdellovibrio bacteriovorus]|uniref:glycine betaine ABC transporter substrate-binding protein n=1 Tax=Bdellovibrio bacteriovorus TaxID=959 RepID=UPI0021CE4037|nr:glycine betaine ABC transporter substrate-binding protein [Bdellovibrio bacteriovorus]UXR63304.1 glycine betaine ABC transporter substrate-binding protein [Bdellovibrio bacteriovorus]